MVVALVAVGGVALAQTLTGNNGDNRLIGRNHRDFIRGGGSDELIRGLRAMNSRNGGAANDHIYAGLRNEQARDTLVGADGNVVISVFSFPAATKDAVNCGPGRERVVADHKDLLSGCERVSRR